MFIRMNISEYCKYLQYLGPVKGTLAWRRWQNRLPLCAPLSGSTPLSDTERKYFLLFIGRCPRRDGLFLRYVTGYQILYFLAPAGYLISGRNITGYLVSYWIFSSESSLYRSIPNENIVMYSTWYLSFFA